MQTLKRFYKAVEVVEENNSFSVTLDGRDVKTPGKNLLSSAHKNLMDEIADEWAAQGDEISPETMPITAFLNTKIDKIDEPKLRQELEQEVAKYAASDLIYYYAEEPDELVQRQKELWQPVQSYFEARSGHKIQTQSGINYAQQSSGFLEYCAAEISKMPAFHFTALQLLTPALGSLLLPWGFISGEIDAGKTADSALIDEIFQAEQWGGREFVAEKKDKFLQELQQLAKILDMVS